MMTCWDIVVPYIQKFELSAIAFLSWVQTARWLDAFLWCVCVSYPLSKGFHSTNQFASRGVWHSRPTTRNEAAGESGKQGLISPAYLPLYTKL